MQALAKIFTNPEKRQHKNPRTAPDWNIPKVADAFFLYKR